MYIKEPQQTSLLSYFGGTVFLGLLTILFIALKLMGYITWSWFWVLSPLIFGPYFAAFFLIIVVIATVRAS